MSQIVLLVSFYKDDFSIEYPTKDDMLLNKETKPQNNHFCYIV